MVNINQRLALYWPLDNLDNGSTNDISGNLYQGTAQGAIELASDPVFGTVMRLGPTPGALYTQPDSIKNAFANNATQFTVCGWINPATLSSVQDRCQLSNVFFSYGTESQAVVELGIAPNNEVQVYISDQSGDLSTSSTFLALTGEWNFIALTYQADAIRLLVNTQIYTFETTPQRLNSLPSGALYVGKSADGACTFQGLVSNFRVFNRALDINGLMAIMKADMSSPLQLFLPLNSIGDTNTPDRSQFEYPVVAHGDFLPTMAYDPKLGNVTQFDGNGAYFAIDGLCYEYQGVIQRITLSFWLQTTPKDTTQTILSFDATNFYEVSIDSVGRLIWTTVDRYGNVDSMHSTLIVTDNNWRYVTVQYSAGSGYKSIHFDAGTNASKTQAHLGQPLGLHSKIRYGTIGVNSVAPAYNTEIGDQFFAGALAQIRLYHTLLTLSQVQADMDNSYPAAPSFAPHNPLAIALYQNGTPNVLHNTGNAGPFEIQLTISNISDFSILLEANSSPVTDLNAQFALYFKQGILDTNLLSNLALSEPDTWNLATSNIQPDGSIIVYLSAKQAVDINAQAALTLTFENIYFNPASDVQSTRIGMNYQNCFFNDTHAPVAGYVEAVVRVD